MDLSPLWISLKIAVTATLITAASGTICGWLVYKLKPGIKGIIDGLMLLPMLLPPTVIGFLLLLVFGKNSPVGTFLFSLGISIIFSWYGAVIAASVVAFPLMYKSARGAFEQIDTNIIHAARTLGVSPLKIFFRLAVPLAWPGIVSGIILAFARALGEFGATLMIAGNIPGKTRTMPVAVFFEAEGGNYSQALFWVTIIIIISFTSLFLLNTAEDLQKNLLHRRKLK